MKQPAIWTAQNGSETYMVDLEKVDAMHYKKEISGKGVISLAINGVPFVLSMPHNMAKSLIDSFVQTRLKVEETDPKPRSVSDMLTRVTVVNKAE
jgi:hypothetical protein